MPFNDILSLELREQGKRGSSKEIEHRYWLTCRKEATEQEIFDWLNQPQETSGTTVAVDRPNGGTSTTGYPILTTFENLTITSGDISYELKRDQDPQYYSVIARYRPPAESSSSGGGGRGDPSSTVPTIRLGVEYAPDRKMHLYSLDTLARVPRKKGTTGIVAPDMGGAINVTDKGTVRGVADPDPGLIETVTLSGFPAFFTPTRRQLFADMRGKVNNAPFTITGVSYPTGSVRFLGASGGYAADGIWPAWDILLSYPQGARVQHNFELWHAAAAMSPGEEPGEVGGEDWDSLGAIQTGETSLDLRFGIIPNTDDLITAAPELAEYLKFDDIADPFPVEGWDLFWVLWMAGVDDTTDKKTQKPVGGYVERLYERDDLNTLIL